MKRAAGNWGVHGGLPSFVPNEQRMENSAASARSSSISSKPGDAGPAISCPSSSILSTSFYSLFCPRTAASTPVRRAETGPRSLGEPARTPVDLALSCTHSELGRLALLLLRVLGVPHLSHLHPPPTTSSSSPTLTSFFGAVLPPHHRLFSPLLSRLILFSPRLYLLLQSYQACNIDPLSRGPPKVIYYSTLILFRFIHKPPSTICRI